MSHSEPETESIIVLSGERCRRECADLSLSLVSETAPVKCSAQGDEVQEKTEQFVSNNPQNIPFVSQN